MKFSHSSILWLCPRPLIRDLQYRIPFLARSRCLWLSEGTWQKSLWRCQCPSSSLALFELAWCRQPQKTFKSTSRCSKWNCQDVQSMLFGLDSATSPSCLVSQEVGTGTPWRSDNVKLVKGPAWVLKTQFLKTGMLAKVVWMCRNVQARKSEAVSVPEKAGWKKSYDGFRCPAVSDRMVP